MTKAHANKTQTQNRSQLKYRVFDWLLWYIALQQSSGKPPRNTCTTKLIDYCRTVHDNDGIHQRFRYVYFEHTRVEWGEVLPEKIEGGVQLPETPTLFQTKICDFL